MLSVGPFPLAAAILACATIVGVLVTRHFARRSVAPDAAVPASRASALLIDMLLVGALVGRIVFVLQWWPDYSANPASIVRIGDGGFAVWAGIPAALAWGWWRSAHQVQWRKPLMFGTVAALLAWGALTGSIRLMQQSVLSLPERALTDVQGNAGSLQAFRGQPVIVNLWATWCGPCRREMPVLARAQREHPGTHFVFVNQGESERTIRDYLQRESLDLRNVLVDPFSAVMEDVGARGLPMTLIFDADGRLVDSHMGELTQASLSRSLKRFGGAAQPSRLPPR